MRKLSLIMLLAGIVLLGGCVCLESAPKPLPVVRAAPPPAPAPAAPRPAPMPPVSTGYNQGTRIYNNSCCGVVRIDKEFPLEAAAGALFEYKIKVTNLTDMALRSVVVNEVLPENFEYESSAPEGMLSRPLLTWRFPGMEAREVKTITVRGKAPEEGWVMTCADATYILPACAKIKIIRPDLELVKTAPAEVLICEMIPLTFRLTNKGTGQANNIQIIDDLPEGLETLEGQSQIVMQVESLPPGRSASKSVMVKATRPGVFVNQAVATADGGLEVKSEKTQTQVIKPVLAITKTGRETQFIGRTIEYTIVVENLGDAIANDVIITDALPDHITDIRLSAGGQVLGSQASWQIGMMAPNSKRELKISFVPTQSGQYLDTTTAKATCADPVKATATTDVRGIPALLLEVVDLADPIEVGQNETYVITVTNQGSAIATNVKVDCQMESAMRFISADGVTSGVESAGAISFAPLGQLAAGEKAVWRVVVRAIDVADVRFGVTMKADQIGRAVQETESTNFYE